MLSTVIDAIASEGQEEHEDHEEGHVIGFLGSSMVTAFEA
jgi:hypothetical protein